METHREPAGTVVTSIEGQARVERHGSEYRLRVGAHRPLRITREQAIELVFGTGDGEVVEAELRPVLMGGERRSVDRSSRDKIREALRTRIAVRYARGVCMRCPKRREKDSKLCTSCRNKARRALAAARKHRK